MQGRKAEGEMKVGEMVDVVVAVVVVGRLMRNLRKRMKELQKLWKRKIAVVLAVVVVVVVEHSKREGSISRRAFPKYETSLLTPQQHPEMMNQVKVSK
jgi:uncharacterized membrane protein